MCILYTLIHWININLLRMSLEINKESITMNDSVEKPQHNSLHHSYINFLYFLKPDALAFTYYLSHVFVVDNYLDSSTHAIASWYKIKIITMDTSIAFSFIIVIPLKII
ncbi:Tkp4 protein [Vanderwaltozyma polyspora DSM 70294]|uniref:Tkp4 protein n=1 Tax=Vanderwaltozyma polyspora (strain ATCC 22028 / DSM 70294 / BCRC 21397 / CBS 2163 / NBRC 10782 / NRRL Y-8283 / UCD 57-17) TaxID=436907 RepID=A7TIX9_VANPO|nr:Tkp4 protein [Vanderwaltozyma polyspora DSM 70294]EDO17791.1 Tkp4 protein [Vanderwaltozyma polyspora DSM 70294]